ncbi:MAG: hypothetical protein QME57_03625 [Patescibacteria group bacterium]|nr:hypothetical protein [Patescibacteria group bacterium]
MANETILPEEEKPKEKFSPFPSLKETPPPLSPIPPYFEETHSVGKPKTNLVKIIIEALLILVLGGGVVLGVRIWDPLWNPFRPSPEKTITKMTAKMKEVKTYHTDLNLELNIKNESEFNIKGKLWGDADNNDPKKIKSAGGINVNFAMEGMQFSLGLETKQIGETLYIRLAAIPAFPIVQQFLLMKGIDFNKMKNQWVKFDEDDIKKLLGKEHYQELMKRQQEEKKKQEAMVEEFKKIIKNKKLYLVKKELRDEKIGKVNTYHYVVTLNNEEIKEIIPDLLNIGGFGIYDSLTAAKIEAKEAKVIADMRQIRTIAEIIYNNEGGYHKVNCDWVDMSKLCKDIFDQVGAKPVIFTSDKAYCSFTPLPVKGYYYCVDSGLNALTTNINPLEAGYCNGQTFVCPAAAKISEEDYKKMAEERLSKDIEKFFEKIGELSAELWIGKEDYLLYRFKGEKLIDLSKFDENEKGTVLIKLDIDLSKFNQPVNIEAPGQYKSLDEIFSPMFGQYGEYLGEAQSRAKDAGIIMGMGQIRIIAELLYYEFNSYENLCEDKEYLTDSLNVNAPSYGQDLKALKDDLISLGAGVPHCRDSATSYCVTIPLISDDRGKWCIDSSFASKEIADDEDCIGTGTSKNPYRCPGTEAPSKFPLEKKIPSYFQASILENLLRIFKK